MIETASPTPVPTPESARILPGADFDDAYRLIVRDGALDAAVAAERAMARAPKWVWPLMALRNLIMAPFGVRVGFRRTAADEPRLGMFPVVSRAPDRVVLGFDDIHLDFRICVDVANLDGDRQAITVTTVVRTHNRLGRAYLCMVKPFHRAIVPAMMAQAGRLS